MRKIIRMTKQLFLYFGPACFYRRLFFTITNLPYFSDSVRPKGLQEIVINFNEIFFKIRIIDQIFNIERYMAHKAMD